MKKNKIKSNKLYLSLGKKIRLTKLSDDQFNGNHPNGINEGYVKLGRELEPPTIGNRYYVECIGGFSTSPVKEIIDKNNFKTLYSTYKVEYLK